jgi:hypothetical protein
MTADLPEGSPSGWRLDSVGMVIERARIAECARNVGEAGRGWFAAVVRDVAWSGRVWLDVLSKS